MSLVYIYSSFSLLFLVLPSTVSAQTAKLQEAQPQMAEELRPVAWLRGSWTCKGGAHARGFESVLIKVELSKDGQTLETKYTTTFFGCPQVRVDIEETLTWNPERKAFIVTFTQESNFPRFAPEGHGEYTLRPSADNEKVWHAKGELTSDDVKLPIEFRLNRTTTGMTYTRTKRNSRYQALEEYILTKQ